MKKIIRILMLFIAMTAFVVSKGHAQVVVVRARMYRPGPVIVRPMRPSPRHVWVGEEWVPGGGTYVYHTGYWAVPPRPGAVWVTGRWRRRHHGYIWVGGFWR